MRRPKLAILSVSLVVALVAPLGADDGAANPLAGLEPLLGAWGVPPEVTETRPELRGRVVHHYAWTVGHNAMRVLEDFARGAPEAAELEGLVYWHPGNQRIELAAVAGHGAGQGRLFLGEYGLLEDGRIERTYDVHYRTPEDTPGESLGGTTRRYREIYTIEGDRLTATLDWWLEGEWQPFGPGTYSLVRIKD